MNDKEKQINILRSEASRLGYYGLAIEDFIKKSINEIVLWQKDEVDTINKKMNACYKDHKSFNNRRKSLLKKIGSMQVKWHDVFSMGAALFSLSGLAFLWQNLIWGDLAYQQWIVFGLVIACATMGSLINEYAKEITDDDKYTLIISLKILAVGLTFVFSLDTLESAMLVRAFILSCLSGIIVHGINIIFIPLVKSLVRMIRYSYLSVKKCLLIIKLNRSRREGSILEYELEHMTQANEVLILSTIHQLEVDYSLAKTASMRNGMSGEIINDNYVTKEVANA